MGNQKILMLECNQHVKMQGVVETARAVCHEMCQPLQGALTFSELMMLELAESDPMYEYAKNVKSCLEEITNITRKLNGINRYEVKEYIEGVNIIDINKSSDKQFSPYSCLFK